jgi:hypothetical protein
MNIISHRGNLYGRDPSQENSTQYIQKALEHGFDVEIDVWYNTDLKQFYLGHDMPTYSVTTSFLKIDRLWCHAKDEECFSKLLDLGVNCFWHENDRFTLTSHGIVWCYPNNWCERGVTVVFDPPSSEILSKNIFGICVDDPVNWRKI